MSGYISQVRYYSYNISRSRIGIEYSFGFRGMLYKYFILRMVHKLHKMLFGDNIEDEQKKSTCS